MTALLLPFLVLAVIGLVLCLIGHVAALFGLKPFGSLTEGLGFGLVVVWLPAILVCNKLAAEFKQKDLWKAALRGCPPWMRRLAYGAFGYTLVNLILFALVVPLVGGRGIDKQPEEIFLCGQLVAFYSAAAAILYSAIVVAKLDPARRCANGHPVSPSANFCSECGAAVPEVEAAKLWKNNTGSAWSTRNSDEEDRIRQADGQYSRGGAHPSRGSEGEQRDGIRPG